MDGRTNGRMDLIFYRQKVTITDHHHVKYWINGSIRFRVIVIYIFSVINAVETSFTYETYTKYDLVLWGPAGPQDNNHYNFTLQTDILMIF